METLTEDDLDWLTTAENKMIRMRKREAQNANRLCDTKRGYPWDSNPWVWVVQFKRVTP